MFINTYIVDNVVQNKVTSHIKQLSDISEVDELIKGLDGITTTTLTFQKSSSLFLCVCGANNSFVLYVENKHNFMSAIVDYTNLYPKKININVSGQISSISEDLIMDLETTIKIAKTFVESGELNNCVEWIPG